LRYIIVAAWLLFMLSLSGWWVYFSLGQVARLVAANIDPASDLVRYQKMLLWEGATLCLFMIGGAAALVFYMYNEMRQSRRVKEFLGTFGHELKTPLAGLMLHVELLKEQCSTLDTKIPTERLIEDLSRLNLQLENALLLASSDQRQLFLQNHSLRDAVERQALRFPNLEISCEGDATLPLDQRAIDLVLGNLIYNAAQHGKALTVNVQIQNRPGQITLTLTDDGQGFAGEVKKLGRLFHRHCNSSGSGVGLYLARELIKDLGGQIEFGSVKGRVEKNARQGFEVRIYFQV